MKGCFQIVEVQPVLFKSSANEHNESLLSDCRVQPVLLKNKKHW